MKGEKWNHLSDAKKKISVVPKYFEAKLTSARRQEGWTVEELTNIPVVNSWIDMYNIVNWSNTTGSMFQRVGAATERQSLNVSKAATRWGNFLCHVTVVYQGFHSNILSKYILFL